MSICTIIIIVMTTLLSLLLSRKRDSISYVRYLHFVLYDYIDPIFAYLCFMKPERLLRAILPDVLIDNFDIVNFDKSADRFDIYLDEKKVQLKEDKTNPDIISYGFGEYRTIQDYPIRGRATYLHVRKRKWLDKSSNEIFSYDWDLSEFDGTRLNSEFVSFLKEGD